jgi:hypothetical protein
VATDAIKPSIPESVFEHRIDFESHWVDKWVVPNPFIGLLYSALQDWHVTLADFAFNADAKNVGDAHLIVHVRELNSTIRLGVNSLVFHSTNPDWGMAEKLVALFDKVTKVTQESTSIQPQKQDSAVAFHISTGSIDLKEATSKLVNAAALGDAKSYGISIYREDSSTLVERSLRYDGIFVRINRTFDGKTSIANIALQLYADETSILRLLGLEGLV